jgi:hypothetical protein
MLCYEVLDYSRKTKLKDRGLLYKTRRKCEVNLKVFRILILVQKLIVFLFFLILSSKFFYLILLWPNAMR